jgi:hypothetical protein
MAPTVFTERRMPQLLAALSIGVSIPYAVLGPNLILDDWFTLWFRMRDGVLWTGGHDQLLARPGAWLVLMVEYGFVGAHPLAIYALQAALSTVAAVLLFVVARRFVSPGRAFAIAAVWVLLPNHSTIDRWAAAMPALVSLVLLLWGLVLLERSIDRGGGIVPALAVFCASALCYEASLAPAGVALLAVPWLAGHKPTLRRLAATEAPLAVTGVWMLANSQHTTGDFVGWFDFPRMLQAHIAAGINRPEGLVVVVAIVGAVGTAIALARPLAPSLRNLPAETTWLVVAGLVVIVVGTLAFVRYPIAPLNLGDRANVVASVGTALVWVGIGTIVWERRRAVGAAAAVVFALVLLVGRVQRDVDYVDAGDDTVAILAALDRTHSDRPPGEVVVGPHAVFHHGIVGLIGTIDQAVRADSGDPTRRARVAVDDEEFKEAPEAMRLDSRDLRP